jgi:hypothetical protein
MLVQKAVLGGLLKTNIPFGVFHSAAGFVSEEFEKRPKRMTKGSYLIMTNGEARSGVGCVLDIMLKVNLISTEYG